MQHDIRRIRIVFLILVICLLVSVARFVLNLDYKNKAPEPNFSTEAAVKSQEKFTEGGNISYDFCLTHECKG